MQRLCAKGVVLTDERTVNPHEVTCVGCERHTRESEGCVRTRRGALEINYAAPHESGNLRGTERRCLYIDGGSRGELKRKQYDHNCGQIDIEDLS